MGDYARVNHSQVMRVVKAHGAISIDALAGELGNSNPWQLLEDLKTGETAFRNASAIGIEGMTIPFTIFPARERARYGYPDKIPTIMRENPHKRTRAKRNHESKGQTNYWPLVGYGDIVPAPAGSGGDYSGEYDDIVEFVQGLLDGSPEWTTFCEQRGITVERVRGVRGGVSVRIKADTADATDTTGIVTGNFPAVA